MCNELDLKIIDNRHTNTNAHTHIHSYQIGNRIINFSFNYTQTLFYIKLCDLVQFCIIPKT